LNFILFPVSDELAYASIREIGALFRRRKLSPVELAQSQLARVARLDPELRAFVTLTAERAMADARAAEAALLGGDDRPLLGIPVGHKDIFATAGIRTTAGSDLLADWIPSLDATAVWKWHEAGTVLLGKLITHEFAFGIQLPGHRFPPARNPWNREYIPGGSSSGSGAALAAGLVYGATGSDTSGSIRGPAAFCGVVGLKPTFGRVSRAGVIPLSWSLDHAGTLARTVEDCALLLHAMAGHDEADPTSSRQPVPDYAAGLPAGIRGLRIGVPRNYFFEGATDETVAAFEAALQVLRELGADVKDITLPALAGTHAVLLILMAEAFAYHESDIRTRPDRYGDVLRERIQAGGLITAAEYLQAQRVRARIARELTEALRDFDLLATPTMPKPAPTLQVAQDPNAGFPRNNMAPFNLAGLPSLAVPCGFTANGLPLSLQLSGRAFDEATVLRAGAAYERATAWHRRRPALP
jgi:aspartyl-tRNA(Asn)/glutamyl-tRNA(Gln) amidotransferase subunit A